MHKVFVFVLFGLLTGCNLSQGNERTTPTIALTPNVQLSTPVAGLIPDDGVCQVNLREPTDLRNGPNLFAGRIRTLDAGTIAPIIGRASDEGWWQIQLGTTIGWLRADASEVSGDCGTVPLNGVSTTPVGPTALPRSSSPPTAAAPVVVPAGAPQLTFNQDTNVRSGPGTSFVPVLGTYRGGQTATILAVNPSGDWYKVTFGSNGAGWVWSGLVTVTGSTSNVAVEVGPPPPPATVAVQAAPQTGGGQSVPVVVLPPVQSFDPNTNVLQNASFDGNYSGRGRPDLNLPEGWNIWVASQPHSENWMNLPPVVFPHNAAPQIQSGSASLNLNKGYATFTAALYQEVSVPANVSMRASAWVWLHSCEPAPCNSDASAGARVRVGIDPNGGSDPNSSDIVWSDFSTPYDSWGLIGVSATSTGSAATMFLYMTQDWPKQENQVYWDSASLNFGA